MGHSNPFGLPYELRDELGLKSLEWEYKLLLDWRGVRAYMVREVCVHDDDEVTGAEIQTMNIGRTIGCRMKFVVAGNK